MTEPATLGAGPSGTASRRATAAAPRPAAIGAPHEPLADDLAVVVAALRRSERLGAVDRLGGEVAHELNNLLMAMQSSLELLGERVDDRERELVDTALDAAARGAALVRRLLVRTRGQPLAAAAVDVGALIESMRGLLGRSLGSSASVRTSCAPGTPRAFVDAGQLELVLLGLALDARENVGGELALSIAVSPGRPVGDGEGAPEGRVRIEVRHAGGARAARAAAPHFSAEGVDPSGGAGAPMAGEFARRSGGAFRRTDAGAGPGEGPGAGPGRMGRAAAARRAGRVRARGARLRGDVPARGVAGPVPGPARRPDRPARARGR